MNSKLSLPRFVTVCHCVPGIPPQKSTIDLLNVDDVVCWILNTSPPAMQLSLKERFDMEMLSEAADLEKKESVFAEAKLKAKEIKKAFANKSK